MTKYEKPMKEFLNKAMKKHRSGSTPELEKFKSLFPKFTKRLIDVIGETPFNIRGRLNTSALDSVMSLLMQNYEQLPDDLYERYKKLIDDPKFQTLTTIGTTDTATVKERFKLLRKHLLD
jgi:hypothetical protein